ncbi:MAG: pyridoxal phosphate-dependent aminotransferase [Romboutsia sp.]|uniref:pyridoxal phosphate-dependent aminotransferase n=1 Tax=Romboutsia sp. TaxID=1965302 RepID=UPI003F360B0E
MISNRLSSITPSYTIGVSNKVIEMKKSGIDIINLSIGEPDFNIPAKAKFVGINSLNSNFTKYDLVPGLNILREQICKKLSLENNCSYSTDEIVVSSGAKHCITNTILALTNSEDEILLPKPYWVSYPEIIKLLNCKPVFVETRLENDFKVDCKELETYITNKTKILILNNPSNPTGSIYTKEELLKIVELCSKHNIYILADEIYERICFNNQFISVASISDLAKDITITINGFSKSSAMTGLRLGYSASNKSIAKAITTIQGHLVSHPCLTSQYIAYSALKDCSSEIDNMVKHYKTRRDLVCNKLDSIENLSYIYPNGAFYVFICINSIKNKFKFKDSFSIEFCNEFLNKHKVAVVPGIAFGMDDFIRISFASNEDILLEGLNRLKLFVSNLHN